MSEHALSSLWLRSAAPSTLQTSPPTGLQNGPVRLGRYLLGQFLGRGRTGTTYLAHDTYLDRPVALKVLHAAPPTPAHRDLLLRCVRAGAAADSPGLCPPLDAGQAEGVDYVASVYADGTPLSAWTANAQVWPEGRAAAAVASAARAVQTAHEQGVVHGAITPGNVFVRDDGRVLLGDFGLPRPGRSLEGDVAALGMLGAALTGPMISPRLAEVWQRACRGEYASAADLAVDLDAFTRPPVPGQPERAEGVPWAWVGAGVATPAAAVVGLVLFFWPAPLKEGSLRLDLRGASGRVIVTAAGRDYEWEGAPLKLPVGDHAITVRARNAEPVTEAVRVRPGETAVLTLNLVPREGGTGRRTPSAEERAEALAAAERARGAIQGMNATEALANAETVLKVDPESADGLYFRGWARLHLGDAAAARADLDAALALSPRDAAALSARAWTRLRQGDHVGGATDAEAALEVSPGWVPAAAARGWARACGGDLAGAIADLDYAAGATPQAARLFLLRSAVRAKAGRADAATDRQHALTLDPTLASEMIAVPGPGTARPPF